MTYFRFYIVLTQNLRMNAMQLAKESISGLNKVFTGSECPLSIITNWKYMNKADYGKAKAMLLGSAAVFLQSLYSCSIMLPLISQLLYGVCSPNWLQVTVSCKIQNAIFVTWELTAGLLSTGEALGDPTVWVTVAPGDSTEFPRGPEATAKGRVGKMRLLNWGLRARFLDSYSLHGMP